MVVYAISDLHLPAGDDKPMDVFGAQWERHFERICISWRELVSPSDIVLLPGDTSWAMQLAGAKQDIDVIGRLPGMKVMIRGNHDYWWSSISRVREALTQGTYALQNDAVMLGGVLIAGTRGWILPAEGVAPEDVKIFERERQRLTLSLSCARKLSASAPLICMTHYPPIAEGMRDTGMTRLMEEYSVTHAVYGHLHGSALAGAFRGGHNGVTYHQVSCDGLDFKLLKIFETR